MVQALLDLVFSVPLKLTWLFVCILITLAIHYWFCGFLLIVYQVHLLYLFTLIVFLLYFFFLPFLCILSLGLWGPYKLWIKMCLLFCSLPFVGCIWVLSCTVLPAQQITAKRHHYPFVEEHRMFRGYCLLLPLWRKKILKKQRKQGKKQQLSNIKDRPLNLW